MIAELLAGTCHLTRAYLATMAVLVLAGVASMLLVWLRWGDGDHLDG